VPYARLARSLIEGQTLEDISIPPRTIQQGTAPQTQENNFFRRREWVLTFHDNDSSTPRNIITDTDRYLLTMSFSRGKVDTTAVTALKPWLITMTNKNPDLHESDTQLQVTTCATYTSKVMNRQARKQHNT
jgi:hypothetical protein